LNIAPTLDENVPFDIFAADFRTAGFLVFPF
jgi:hypothetical protein